MTAPAPEVYCAGEDCGDCTADDECCAVICGCCPHADGCTLASGWAYDCRYWCHEHKQAGDRG